MMYLAMANGTRNAAAEAPSETAHGPQPRQAIKVVTTANANAKANKDHKSHVTRLLYVYILIPYISFLL